MLKPDRFSCSQKIRLKRDPPVMSKLAATDNHDRRPFKPQIYKSRGQNRSYGQGRYQPRSNDRNKGYGADSNTTELSGL